MNAIFAEELLEGWLTIYMDDILVHTEDDEALHRRLVHRVLDKLAKHDLFLKPKKCLFEKQSMEFLGVVLGKGTIQMDPTKLKGVADWPTPRTLRDVRAFLGFTGFYRYFVPNYSLIARPLIELTRKTTPFHWEEPQIQAFERLKTLMCSKPILRQPDYKRQFFLATDASAYGVGAVLLQEGEINPRTKKPTQHPIAYYSNTFTPTERNYDIYERELLAVIKALQHWRPHLAATEKPVVVLTDHANLTFWKIPKSVNRRVARWFAFLQDYNLQIKHVPGKLHAAADMLSRPPSADKGENDNLDLTLLPPQIFVRTADAPWERLLQELKEAQDRHRPLMEDWKRSREVTKDEGDLYTRDGKIVVPPDEALKRQILRRNHDTPTRGHPGRDRTIDLLERHFWWPGLRKWTEEYVRGCATCQQNKTRTHPLRIPSFCISTKEGTLPFQTIAMDLITNLPSSRGNDAILTIVDHGCTRAAVFLPCKTTISGEGVANLYHENVYRWFGLPAKIILDRDPRFMSHFARALCQRLGIEQNISTAFHPQTDGISKRKNQWVELFLRHLTSNQQDDWSDWLTVATAAHNHFKNATTGVAPIEALLGYLPRLDYSGPPSMNERAEERTINAHQKRVQAKEAINHWAGEPPKGRFETGNRVWLEGKNLKLPYQNLKLAPKRYGPFKVTKIISPVAYQLNLPPSWTIHNVFHAGLLSPYRETKQYGANFPRPPPDVINGEEEYEVEAIRNHRRFGRQRTLQYLIKWKGYPEADNTWENHGDVFAEQLIRQYHQTHPLTDKRKTSSRRVDIRSTSITWPLPLPHTALSSSMKKSSQPSQFRHAPSTSPRRSYLPTSQEWNSRPQSSPSPLPLDPPSWIDALETLSRGPPLPPPSPPSIISSSPRMNPSRFNSSLPREPPDPPSGPSPPVRRDGEVTRTKSSLLRASSLRPATSVSACRSNHLRIPPPSYQEATTPPETASPTAGVRSPSQKVGRRTGVRPLISSFTSRTVKRLWRRSLNASKVPPRSWVPLGDLPTHISPMSSSLPPTVTSPSSPKSSRRGWSMYSAQIPPHSPQFLERPAGLMTGAWSPTWNAITPWTLVSEPSRVNASDSTPRSQISYNRCASVITGSLEPMPERASEDARLWTTTSSRGILMDARSRPSVTPSVKPRVGLSPSRRVMTSAWCSLGYQEAHSGLRSRGQVRK